MKSLGVVMLVIGIVTALSIVGIVIAWLPIWLGVLLFQAAGRIETAFATEDAGLFRESLAKLKTSFVIQSVLLLIYLVGVAMLLLAMAVVGVNALWLPFFVLAQFAYFVVAIALSVGA